jgi:hypothetical protein
MGTTSVVMGLVLDQDRLQVPHSRAGCGRDLHGLDAGVGQDRVERVGELPGPVPDQEPEARGALPQIHHEVAGLLSGPRPVRVRGHAEDVHITGAHLDHEKAVQAPQDYRAIHVEEVDREHRRCADPVADLEQLTSDSLVSPAGVLGGGPRTGTAQHGDLVPQHEKLSVLGGQ